MSNVVKPYLIAEIGINHNGDIEIAKKLINEAKAAKFDAVKFQKRDINLVYSKEILHPKRVRGALQLENKKLVLSLKKGI